MLIINCEGRKIAKFEGDEGNKAMDWITQKGLYRVDSIPMFPDVIWICKPLPNNNEA